MKIISKGYITSKYDIFTTQRNILAGIARCFFPVFHRHLTAIINFFLCVIYPEQELNRLSIQGLYFHIKIKTHIPVLLGLDYPKDLFLSISSCNSVSLVVRSQHLLPDCGYLKSVPCVVAMHCLCSRIYWDATALPSLTGEILIAANLTPVQF